MITITQTPRGWLATVSVDRHVYRQRLHSTESQARLWVLETIDTLAQGRAA
jgi:hypothetical protein